MKILVNDQDAAVMQKMRAILEPLGHEVTEVAVRNDALALLEKEVFEVVICNPTPLPHARPVVLSIRRHGRNYPYIILISPDLTPADVIKDGANNVLRPDFSADQLTEIVESGGRLRHLVQRIGDESEDFRSAGGVIAKSAFNQIFLSALERADRYAEQAYLLFISITNYHNIQQTEGPYASDYAMARLSQFLVRERRQSDIIAQTAKNEFCLMLQRPLYQTEPTDAANRFGEALKQLTDMSSTPTMSVDLAVRLITIPVGTLVTQHVLHFDPQ